MSQRWDRVTALFGAARALAPHLRSSFLQIACEGDEPLRADVEELLSTDTDEDDFLQGAPWAALAQALAEHSLPAGQILKHRYRIEEELAAGGQARVYRATDELLSRPVVIKLMRAEGREKQLLKSRFDHEMQALAQIDHPSVVGILDVGEMENGSPYLVIQHIAGISLREALHDGPLSLSRAAAILRQIGTALRATHALGIAHRDLKPENVMLQRLDDGTELVKLIDFGLAKVERPAPGSAYSSVVVAGTIRYMAPEQFQGENSTASDIYALGLIACEMLSGQPDPYALEVPVAVREQLRAALAYRPEDRPPDAGGFCSQLAQALDDAARAPRIGRRPVLRQTRLAWALAALALASIAAVVVMFSRESSIEVPAVNLSLAPPERTTYGASAVSPDGRRIAVLATDSAGKTQLWVRRLDSVAYLSLAGTEGASFPFWSPDSRYIGFFADGKLKKIQASGGPALTICAAESASQGGAWNRNGEILFTPNPATPLYRVPATGGEAVPLTTLDAAREESSHEWPQFLPDGRHFLFFVESAQPEAAGIYVSSLDSSLKRRVLAAGSNGLYSSGHLLFLREHTLMAQPFDATQLQLAGEARPLAERVGAVESSSRSLFSVSDRGVLAYVSAPGASSQLLWFDRSGQKLARAFPDSVRRNYTNVNLSPDGSRLAADVRDPDSGSRAVWLYDLARGGESRLTFGSATDASPVWAPDSRRVIFFSSRDGIWNLYQKAATGAGNDELLLKSSASKITCDCSRDGRYLVYREWDPKTKWDLWALPLEGDRRPFRVVQTPFEDGCGQISPDGRWLAYFAGVPGREEVYVQPFGSGAQTTARWQISIKGGAAPRWRRDGKELFYLARDHKLMAAAVTSGETFAAGPPKPLFETHAAGFLSYAVSADGQRFIVNTPVEQPSSIPSVILNWTAALDR